MKNTNRLWGAILLIAGTSIGAGMLALPVTTAAYGFIPTLILFVLSWLSMTIAAFFMLEANLWFQKDANLISMAKETLGKAGEIIAWIAYLLLLYSLMSAYLSGMNALLVNAIHSTLHFSLTPLASSILLIMGFGVIIYLGATTIDYLNRILMMGLVISYLILVFLIGPHVNVSNLTPKQFHHSWLALPIIITSFGFQIIIPSLRTYLNTDVKKIRLAILVGSIIPLVVYLIWEILILGTLPYQGPHGLLAILKSGQPATGLTVALENILHSSYIGRIASLFAFFAIATSFVGVSFSLFDFLADGLRIKKTKLGRIVVASITFLPPLVFVFTYPQGFILALGFAGIFVALLLMILPALIVLSGRYLKRIDLPYKAKGGIISLVSIIIFSLLIIIIELFFAK